MWMRLVALCTLATAVPLCLASDCESSKFRIRGLVLDKEGAALPNANVSIDHTKVIRTGSQGDFTSGCLAEGPHQFEVAAANFEAVTSVVQAKSSSTPLILQLRVVTASLQVGVQDTDALSGSTASGAQTLTSTDLAGMADDPDELTRELQVLATAAGGAPGRATIAIDGFQNGGLLPPKSSILFVRINPDLFSAEYEDPPYEGGRIEVYTKPGNSKLHGSLFTNQSSSWMNAKDPLAVSRAATKRQRYGVELSGPIRINKADFVLALEHRQIDQFSVVNARTLDISGQSQDIVENVPTPKSLWQGSIRIGWIPMPKSVVTLSYSANVNNLANVGTGGVVLPEAGFQNELGEHVVHLSNIQTLTPNLVHETRIGYTWLSSTQTPNSTASSVQVAGAFTGGGSPTQHSATRERDLEIDDDLLVSRGKHTLKLGIELLDAELHDSLPANFNGTSLFAGGQASVLGGSGLTQITGLEQYGRALNSQPGGTPTVFAAGTGTENVSLNQFRAVVYGQDEWKLQRNLQLSLGLRWQMQNVPRSIANIAPRAGISWSPDHSQHWVIHLRSGLFFSPVITATALEDRRLDPSLQQQHLVYSPSAYSLAQTPAGVFAENSASVITTIRSPFVGVVQTPSLQSHVGFEYTAPGHWHTQGNLYLVRAWNVLRSVNINPSLDGSPLGPRPGTANENIDAYRNSGTQHGNVLFMGVDQRGMKHLQVFAGYIRFDLRSDADTDGFFPQSSFSNAGETARLSSQSTHQFITYSTVKAFFGLTWTTQFDAASGKPLNITTGLDNNGDGNFNDRPFYAAAPAGNGIYSTPFGVLASTGSGPTLARNTATLPWTVHLDANLSRAFSLPSHVPQQERRMILNLRSANLLNHDNVTAVGGVLGSPLFLQPYAAETGRRIEAGLRFEF